MLPPRRGTTGGPSGRPPTLRPPRDASVSFEGTPGPWSEAAAGSRNTTPSAPLCPWPGSRSPNPSPATPSGAMRTGPECADQQPPNPQLRPPPPLPPRKPSQTLPSIPSSFPLGPRARGPYPLWRALWVTALAEASARQGVMAWHALGWAEAEERATIARWQAAEFGGWLRVGRPGCRTPPPSVPDTDGRSKGALPRRQQITVGSHTVFPRPLFFVIQFQNIWKADAFFQVQASCHKLVAPRQTSAGRVVRRAAAAAGGERPADRAARRGSGGRTRVGRHRRGGTAPANRPRGRTGVRNHTAEPATQAPRPPLDRHWRGFSRLHFPNRIPRVTT